MLTLQVKDNIYFCKIENIPKEKIKMIYNISTSYIDYSIEDYYITQTRPIIQYVTNNSIYFEF